MRTSNPVLNAETFRSVGIGSDDVMTITGTINKSAILLGFVILSSMYTWSLFYSPAGAEAVGPWMIFGAIGGFITAIVTVFKRNWAPVTAPIYALLQGLFLGGISSVLESQLPGIVMQAMGLTFSVAACMLVAYRSGLIQPTEKFRAGIVAATGAVALVYVLSFLLSFFGISMPMIHSAGPVGILFSLAVVTIAALNLILDFDLIESGARAGAPKYMEWFAAFGLMVTLIWLYIETLRLLSKIRER